MKVASICLLALTFRPRHPPTQLAGPWPSPAPRPVGIPRPASPANSQSLCPGRSYDEKVDVFSFGIVLCEVGPGWAAVGIRPDGSSPFPNHPNRRGSGPQRLLGTELPIATCIQAQCNLPSNLLGWPPAPRALGKCWSSCWTDHRAGECRPRLPASHHGLWP